MPTPLYLSGAVRPELARLERVGFMLTPRMGNRDLHGLPWAADTGCYSVAGERRFDATRYLAWLAGQDARRCLFATLPDKICDPVETLRRSRPVLEPLRRLGYPTALVAQDGLEHLAVPWRAIDALFLGGSTSWKLGPGAAHLARETKRRGLWLHMGRVNSLRRLRYAATLGCDSVDGTFIAYAPTANMKRLSSWMAAKED